MDEKRSRVVMPGFEWREEMDRTLRGQAFATRRSSVVRDGMASREAQA